MKVSLIVASGVHEGKAIPIAGAKFLIGRDPSCQLRPASQAISKQHCGFIVRDGKVYAIDYGSTNGTSVNDVALEANTEREVQHGDRIKAGPLDFTLSAVQTKSSDSTPLPAEIKGVATPSGEKLRQAATGSKPAMPKAKAESEDDIAAMMLSMGDDDSAAGSASSYGETTIMEMPTSEMAPGSGEKQDEKKAPVPTKDGSSDAASELLRKYMKRPR